MDWVAYGPHAALIRFGDRPDDAVFERGRAILESLETDPPPGLLEVVPAYASVLLRFSEAVAAHRDAIMAELVERLKGLPSTPRRPSEIRQVPVVYDGDDLPRVASENRLSVADVIRLHSERVYKVYMLGFSPGFPYLGDLHPRLHTPRKASPRVSVPAGSVAIGGAHTGIYSIDSPGGWNLIGRTPLRLFNPQASGRHMFLLAPGDRLRFIPVSG